MLLEVFDVEHGACSLFTADNGKFAMIDCGHNATTGWRPGDTIVRRGVREIEALLITNYDEDHVSGLPNLRDQVDVRLLYRNKSVSASAIRSLKSEEGMGPGIDRLVHEIEHVFTVPGGTPVLDGIEIEVFWNRHPEDFDDENNLSMVVFVKYGGKAILFPGDLERPGWLKLMQLDRFRTMLPRVAVLFASHHGREDGICGEMFGDELCKPWYVVISDKYKGYQTQETTNFYRGVSRGGPFRGETRYVLTTRRDGDIDFTFGPNDWYPS